MVLVTRMDIKAGYQAVQPAHALAEFATVYPKIFGHWHKNHKNLVILAAENESALIDLFKRSRELDIRSVMFREPDLNDEVTAIALEPGDKTYKLTSTLPLALKEKRALVQSGESQ